VPAAPCSKSGTASPHDELVASAVTRVGVRDGALFAKLTYRTPVTVRDSR
jgi:hypothetical protein